MPHRLVPDGQVGANPSPRQPLVSLTPVRHRTGSSVVPQVTGPAGFATQQQPVPHLALAASLEAGH